MGAFIEVLGGVGVYSRVADVRSVFKVLGGRFARVFWWCAGRVADPTALSGSAGVCRLGRLGRRVCCPVPCLAFGGPSGLWVIGAVILLRLQCGA